jgi:hypothetical protein
VLSAKFGDISRVAGVNFCGFEFCCHIVAVTISDPFDYLIGTRLGVVGDDDFLEKVSGGCDFCDGVSYASGSYKKDPHFIFT